MAGDTHKLRPQEGDILETKPIRVTKKGVVLGSNPTNWGPSFVRIEDQNLDLLLPKEVVLDIHQEQYPFIIHDVDDSCPAKIVKKSAGGLVVELSSDHGSIKNQSEFQFESPGREEPILWDGTDQNRDSDKVQRRHDVFKESDSRGSKNDLLNGNL
ncbi:hypothetical protein [Haloarchaeobius sp. HRN-SO-5]|uniref:hypothetical protein n=1 Tax=Haloarchaeobius sp. HRN-SO-5 TaxID=3446118 RepID=UPI003EB7EBF8